MPPRCSLHHLRRHTKEEPPSMASTFQTRGAPAKRGTGRGGPGGRRGGKKGGRGGARTVALRRDVLPVERQPVQLASVLTVAELSDQLQTTGIEIIKELMKLGMM